MKKEATITVLNKNSNFLSLTNEKTAKILVKRKRAIKIDDNTIKLIFDRKDWIKLKTDVIKKEKRKCYICGKTIPKNECATVDHLVPRSKFGEDSKSNLHCCCQRCNEDKGNRTVEEYYNHVKSNIGKYDYIDLENLKKYIEGV